MDDCPQDTVDVLRVASVVGTAQCLLCRLLKTGRRESPQWCKDALTALQARTDELGSLAHTLGSLCDGPLEALEALNEPKVAD